MERLQYLEQAVLRRHKCGSNNDRKCCRRQRGKKSHISHFLLLIVLWEKWIEAMWLLLSTQVTPLICILLVPSRTKQSHTHSSPPLLWSAVKDHCVCVCCGEMSSFIQQLCGRAVVPHCCIHTWAIRLAPKYCSCSCCLPLRCPVWSLSFILSSTCSHMTRTHPDRICGPESFRLHVDSGKSNRGCIAVLVSFIYIHSFWSAFRGNVESGP